MWVFMLGFAGFPLTGGFFAKLYVFSAAYEAGWWWLVVVGVARDRRQPRLLPRASIRAMYMRPEPAARVVRVAAVAAARRRATRARDRVGAALVVTVGSFFFVQPMIDARPRGRSDAARS